MRAFKNERGFIETLHWVYPPSAEVENRIVCESSIVGDYEDALDKPGSSALWVGSSHHLNREEVADLIHRMQHWLDHKRLPPDETGG